MEYLTRKNMADLWERLVKVGARICVSEQVYCTDAGIQYQRERSKAEHLMWDEMRSQPHMSHFMPEYRVDGKYLDFADPYAKIAIEIDGKEWHNAEKDAKRDAEIEALGWKVYRLKAGTLWRCYDDVFKEHFGFDIEDSQLRNEIQYEDVEKFHELYRDKEATCFCRWLSDTHYSESNYG